MIAFGFSENSLFERVDLGELAMLVLTVFVLLGNQFGFKQTDFRVQLELLVFGCLLELSLLMGELLDFNILLSKQPLLFVELR